MPIEGGFVGMVDRELFDEFLRTRAADAGVERITGTFEHVRRESDGTACIVYSTKRVGEGSASVRTRAIIGADGANSAVARETFGKHNAPRNVFAYHEIVHVPPRDQGQAYDGERCDIHYEGALSPDFYAWIFPHGETASIGVGSAHKGFDLRQAVAQLRSKAGISGWQTLRREGAPIPLKPRRRWDNGRDTVLAGDAAGVVAPASGEGIYYAMCSGRMAAEAVEEMLATGRAAALATARKRFMKAHGTVFWVLGLMQYFWYASDGRRERFVKMCADPDVQRLTWDAYMNKELKRRDPAAHMRIFFADLGHLMGLGRV